VRESLSVRRSKIPTGERSAPVKKLTLVSRGPRRRSVAFRLGERDHLRPHFYVGVCVSFRDGSNLVDPASSHTLVSKIKPCMSK